jgi:aminoglycoside 3-N-acetyltransferase I
MNQTDYVVKQVTASDLPLMRQLLAVYGRAFDDVATFSVAPPSDAYLQRLLGSSEFITIVGLVDGTVVAGGLSAYVLRKFEQERAEIYIYDLAVDERYRRRGIATALIRELQRIGRTAGAYVIFVQADPGDAPAIALYTKLGVREDVHHFDIAVAADGAPPVE